MKPTTDKNNQPKHVLNVSATRMDSTNANRKKMKPSFDMGVNEKRAAELYKQGGTNIE